MREDERKGAVTAGVKSPRSLRLFVLACLAGPLMGCAQLASSLGKGLSNEPDESSSGDAPLPAACGESRRTWNMKDAKGQVMARVCRGHRPMIRMSVAKANRTFDDRHPDLLVAAGAVIDCADLCGERAPIAMAVTSYYGSLLSRDKLERALEGVDVPAEVRTAFIDRALAAVPEVETMATSLDARRKKMYFDTFWSVVESRQAYYERHASRYGKFDALLARSREAREQARISDELIDDFESLRADYLAQCDGDGCRYEPFVTELSQELTLLLVEAGHAHRALAENRWLQAREAGRHRFSVETGTAIYRAMEEERHQHGLYVKAKRGGIDTATLARRFGDPPPLPVDPDRSYAGAERLPDFSRLIEGGPSVKYVADVVASVKKDAKGMARVQFKRQVSKHPVRRCYRTGRISGVRWDSANRARLIYETKCKKVGEKTRVDITPPVKLPAQEVAEVKPGEILETLVDSSDRQGFVLQVSTPAEDEQESRVLQLRGARIGG